MAFLISSRVERSLNKTQKTPGIAIVFDGIEQIFTSVPVLSYYTLDSGYFFDSGLTFDSFTTLENQLDVLSLTGGASSTTTKIDYKIDPDLGIGESITSMKISLINDKKNSVVGVLQSYELLGRKVRVRMVPDVSSAIYPIDYFTIFRGIVDEISYEQGTLRLSFSHPDQKKRQTIFIEHTTELTSNINNSVTSIGVVDADGFLKNITGPNGFEDAAFTGYVRIDDEIIYFDPSTTTSTTLNGCIRGSLSTSAVGHDEGTEVKSYYVLEGNAMDLALKIMLSGWNDYFIEDVTVASILASNQIQFEDKYLEDEIGITVGDFVTITGAVNGANNETLAEITSIDFDEADYKTTLTVSGVTFVNESTANIKAAFRSKYDTLPSGLRMSPDEVDVLAHQNLRDQFLFSADMRFYIKTDIENAKDFINEEIYKPLAAFSLPKNSRSSVGYTIPPLPDQQLKTLTSDNVKDPVKIKHFRQIGRNFYNSILAKYNEDQLEDEFNSGYFATDAESRTRIPVGNKVFTIESKGLRSQSLISNAANRRFYRYKFAASQIQNIKTTFGYGFNIDIGDNVYVDSESLLIYDVNNGNTNFGTRLFQVIQKSLDLRTGDITFSLLDTNFTNNARYGYISPASYLTTVTDDKTFTLTESFGATEEFSKWSNFIGATINVRTTDYTVSATGILKSVGTDNVIVLENNLSVTPSAGMLMEFSSYDSQSLDNVKLLYTHITNGSAAFGDGGNPYYMI